MFSVSVVSKGFELGFSARELSKRQRREIKEAPEKDKGSVS